MVFIFLYEINVIILDWISLMIFSLLRMQMVDNLNLLITKLQMSYFLLF